MRLKRTLLACVISLGISLQGFASVITIETPCPMVHAAMHDEGAHDCCGDVATFAKTGKLCNMGVACHVDGQALQSVVATLQVTPGSITDTPMLHLNPASWDPSYVWRPPALI